MSKIHPKGVTAQKTGAVFTCNDPLSFKNGGGKKTGSNGVTREGTGPTINVSNGLVSMPNANKTPPMTKVKSSKSAATTMSQNATSYCGSNGGSGRSPSVK